MFKVKARGPARKKPLALVTAQPEKVLWLSRDRRERLKPTGMKNGPGVMETALSHCS